MGFDVLDTGTIAGSRWIQVGDTAEFSELMREGLVNALATGERACLARGREFCSAMIPEQV